MPPISLDVALEKVKQLADETERASQASRPIAVSRLGELKAKIESWQYGEYGWTSPVSLMMTAAWVKWLDPSQDVCRIWAHDEQGRSIPGGYSIRTYDETVTIPVICRHGIHEHFCSNNSGMQGTRALEKSRSLKRLNRGPLGQSVRWDDQLFTAIMNDIDALSSDKAKLAFQLFFTIGLRKKGDRLRDLQALGGSVVTTEHGYALITEAAHTIADPQFVRTVAAVCVDALVAKGARYADCRLEGVDERKTGANARSLTPGDFWITAEMTPVVAGEAKDASKQFGFDVLSAVEARWAHNPSLDAYYLITASAVAVDPIVATDERWQARLLELQSAGKHVIIFAMRDLISLVASHGVPAAELIRKIGALLADTPDLKQDTVPRWSNFLT
jgi:hypothetical protein